MLMAASLHDIGVKAFRKALPAMRRVRAALPDQLGAILNLDFRAGESAAGDGAPATASVGSQSATRS
jgi:hypothetical protein